MARKNQHVIDLVDDYLHEVLSDADTERVRHHCQSCTICSAALEEAERRLEALKGIPPSEASEQLIQSTVEGVMSGTQRSHRRRKLFRKAVLCATAASVLMIGGLNAYYLLIKTTPFDVRVLGQSEWMPGTTAGLRVGVFRHADGRQLDGVPVSLTLHRPGGGESVQLARFTTGRDTPVPRFTLPDWDEGQYELRIVAEPDGSQEIIHRSIHLRRKWRVMLGTDKPVYQPGQTIRIRSLTLRQPDLKPVAGQQAVFRITDPKGNIILKQPELTSEFGIVSVDCPLAEEILSGAYQIECRLGNAVAARTVEIKKYTLPKFRVQVQLDHPYYAPGQEVIGTVQCDYFFGQPVGQANVRIQARTSDTTSNVLAEIQHKTDRQGIATFRFALPDYLVGREQTGGNASFQVAVQVTDQAGQIATAGSRRMVTLHPIQVQVIPESGRLVRNQSNTIFVYASYADGSPARARLIVQGLEQELHTNALGVASLEMTPRDPRLGLTLRAVDAEGLEGRATVQLSTGGSQDFLILPERAVLHGGETLSLTVLSGGDEPVFVDLLKHGQTVLTRTVAMQRGRGSLQVDLPPDLFGALRLVAYRFGNAGLALRRSRTIYVRPAAELKIQATLDAEQYRPGQQAVLDLQLTDEAGNPAPGAISLAAVDEAVFSVMNQSAGMERVFFLLEEQLLEPVYALYNWAPDLPGNFQQADRELFERALFSRTAEAGGRTRMATSSASEPYTLSVRTYPDKTARFQQWRTGGLKAVKIAWLTLAGTLMLLGLGALAAAFPRTFAVSTAALLLVGCGAVLALLLLPATQFHRLASNFSAPDAAMTVERIAEGDDMDIPAMDDMGSDAGGEAPLRVRQWFPETLLWKPELITDDQGHARLELDLADSITTWRLSAGAVSSDGRLGGGQFPIRVFQPFFVDLDLPVTLTRNDQVSVPIVVYNYLDQEQVVELSVKEADWFQRLAETGQPLESSSTPLMVNLAPGQVRSVHLPFKVVQVGKQQLEIIARSGELADAVRREIEVVPDGRRVEDVSNGVLEPSADLALNVPEGAIPGSIRALVKLYPSTFSQLVEGLDSIFQMPHGCFEQTSSTTYPNVLALQYLKRTGQEMEAVEAKARQYIHIGYQRLLTFEVDGGGFDWYGRPPANSTLTAYGLMEFEDMARVHEVDSRLIARTRAWLLQQRDSDGSWQADGRMLRGQAAADDAPERDPRLMATAYIAWAVFAGGQAQTEAAVTKQFLLSHPASVFDNPYTLALMVNALAVMETDAGRLEPYVTRLIALRQTSANEKRVWWELPGGTATAFHGGGRGGAVETTALATLALLHSGREPATTRRALAWLIANKDAAGTWHSTQATILALKALLAGSKQPLGGEQTRKIDILLDQQLVRALELPPDQSEVTKQIDLSDLLQTGQNRLRLVEHSQAGTGYSVVLWYHVDRPAPPKSASPSLSIDISYDRQRLTVDDTVTAEALVVNQMQRPAPMVILDLPIPGGFRIERGELDELQGSGVIGRYQITPRKAIIYLRQLLPGEPLKLRYRLRATMPVRVAVPPGQAYEYYNPDRRGTGGAAQLEVSEA